MAQQPVEPAPEPVQPSTTPSQPVPAPTPPVYTRPTAVPPPAPRMKAVGLAGRIGLTLAGAAGMIIGSFMGWFQSFAGNEIGLRTLWGVPHHTGVFIRSAGAVTILLGLIAIVGLAPRSGWLTRLAGALGVVVFILLTIQVYRAPGGFTIADVSIGAWVVLAGSILALIGGFMGTRYRVVYPAPTGVVEPES
jgi:hypothetical protein